MNLVITFNLMIQIHMHMFTIEVGVFWGQFIFKVYSVETYDGKMGVYEFKQVTSLDG